MNIDLFYIFYGFLFSFVGEAYLFTRFEIKLPNKREKNTRRLLGFLYLLMLVVIICMVYNIQSPFGSVVYAIAYCALLFIITLSGMKAFRYLKNIIYEEEEGKNVNRFLGCLMTVPISMLVLKIMYIY